MSEQQLTPREKQEVKDNEQTRPGRFYVPDVDIFESEDGLHIFADMPGVDESSVDVELDDDVLTIEGRVSLQEYDGLQPQYTEYNVGNFLRRFSLADAFSFDGARITARMSNGVLQIQLPRAEKTKLRKIAVVAG